MCPEFLREGSGIADFYNAPFMVIGTADPAVAETVAGLFSFTGSPVRVTATRVAESLKYACNAFHATKVSFTNELSRLLRLLGVDAREVMSLFCEDQVLYISPAYLRPGFAFGGSCLPKDLRSLMHLARVNGADLPLLAGTLATNDLVINDVLDRWWPTASGPWRCSAWSFKADTDDLRESPNVELAERLLGKGFDAADLRPGGAPGQAGRGEPAGGRVEAAAPGPSARRTRLRGAWTGRHGHRVLLEPAVAEALLAQPPRHLVDLSGRARRRDRGAARLRGGRLVSRILIIVQNLPVPFDRRVWLESQALRDAGYQVTVVCPKGDGDPAHEVIDGIEIYKYRPYAPGGSKAGFTSKYIYRSWRPPGWSAKPGGLAAVRGDAGLQLAVHLLADRLALRARDRDQVRVRPPRPVPSCTNPGSPAAPGCLYRGLRALERGRTARRTGVISTNGSYRDIAVRRSGVQDDRVTLYGPARTRTSCGAARHIRTCAAGAVSWPPTSA